MAVRRGVAVEIRRLRHDAGISQASLAAAAGLNQGHLSRIEASVVEPSIAVLVALGDALGADLAIRLYPTTGPRVHEDLQAAMLQATLPVSHPRWKRLVEVGVTRPARGSIDLVLADPLEGVVVATEFQSDLRRLEQQVRWAADKAASLPSSEAWRLLCGAGPAPRIARCLVLRSTARTRELARRFEDLLRAVYPAPAVDVIAAITGTAPWPGDGIVWCRVERGVAELLAGPPRGVGLGR
jgi:transcriptional regulator with XRE-family HTH domain